MFNIIFFISFLYSCENLQIQKIAADYNYLRCIVAKQTFPQFDEKGKLLGYDEMFVRAYYFRNMVLYYLPYRFDSSSNDRMIKSETRTRFFVYQNDANYGFEYNKYRSLAGKKLLVDSAFRFEWIVKNNLYSVFEKSFPALLSKSQNKDSETVTVLYSFRDIGDKKVLLGKCYLSFSKKLINVDISLSRQLDSMYKMKLYKAKFVFYKDRRKKSEITSDDYESNLSLEEAPISNRDEVMSYFTRFIEDDKKYRN